MKKELVDAIQVSPLNLGEVEKFLGGDLEFRDGKVVIATVYGALTVEINDWIIRGNNDLFYGVDPILFNLVYEAGQ